MTEAERATLTGLCANFSLWLEEAEAKQAELPLYETPAYLSSQAATPDSNPHPRPDPIPTPTPTPHPSLER